MDTFRLTDQAAIKKHAEAADYIVSDGQGGVLFLTWQEGPPREKGLFWVCMRRARGEVRVADVDTVTEEGHAMLACGQWLSAAEFGWHLGPLPEPNRPRA